MLRKNIVKQLNEVAETAHRLNDFRLENIDTGETINIDTAIAKHLIISSIAYAALLVNGEVKEHDPERVVACIITTAEIEATRGE